MISKIFKIKEYFEILCLKTNIPNTDPRVPPINEIINSENSEILRFEFLAFDLSIPNSRKLKRFTVIK